MVYTGVDIDTILDKDKYHLEKINLSERYIDLFKNIKDTIWVRVVSCNRNTICIFPIEKNTSAKEIIFELLLAESRYKMGQKVVKILPH